MYWLVGQEDGESLSPPWSVVPTVTVAGSIFRASPGEGRQRHLAVEPELEPFHREARVLLSP